MDVNTLLETDEVESGRLSEEKRARDEELNKANAQTWALDSQVQDWQRAWPCDTRFNRRESSPIVQCATHIADGLTKFVGMIAADKSRKHLLKELTGDGSIEAAAAIQLYDIARKGDQSLLYNPLLRLVRGSRTKTKDAINHWLRWPLPHFLIYGPQADCDSPAVDPASQNGLISAARTIPTLHDRIKQAVQYLSPNSPFI